MFSSAIVPPCLTTVARGPGGTYFFTVNCCTEGNDLLTRRVELLREIVSQVGWAKAESRAHAGQIGGQRCAFAHPCDWGGGGDEGQYGE